MWVKIISHHSLIGLICSPKMDVFTSFVNSLPYSSVWLVCIPLVLSPLLTTVRVQVSVHPSVCLSLIVLLSTSFYFWDDWTAWLDVLLKTPMNLLNSWELNKNDSRLHPFPCVPLDFFQSSGTLYDTARSCAEFTGSSINRLCQGACNESA